MHRELQLWVTLISARRGRIGMTPINRGDRRAISKRGSLYEPFIACLSKKVERFIASKRYELIFESFLLRFNPTSRSYLQDYNPQPLEKEVLLARSCIGFIFHLAQESKPSWK